MTDVEITQFLRSFRTIADLAARVAPGDGVPLRDALSEYLGGPANEMPVVSEQIANHRFADWDVALEILASADERSRVIGVGGAEARYFQNLADYLADGSGRFPVGQADYASVAVSAEDYRQVVGMGVRLFAYEGEPVAVLQRAANPRFGQEKAIVEIVCADPKRSERLLARARALATEKSVLRGHVLTFSDTGFGPASESVAFLERPVVSADEVVLAPGALERITEHVVGIAQHAEVLRSHRQHLKRGVLLYGPPGTGKTHTVRHLIARSPEHTVVVLAGAAFKHIHLAAALARALQPAIVVLEDCDLVAEDRSFDAGQRPLLFEVLDAMDGLDGDSDVTFILTTNRVEALERALTQRPGRVDLAAEIALPDEAARRRLLELYAGDTAYDEAALADAATRTDGMPASFVKELMRRAVLTAAKDGVEPAAEHLTAALDGMLDQDAELTRVLLGG